MISEKWLPSRAVDLLNVDLSVTVDLSGNGAGGASDRVGAPSPVAD